MPQPVRPRRSLAGVIGDESDVARPLITVVDEVLEAQRRLEHRVRGDLGLGNTDFRALLVVHRRQRRRVPVHPGDLTRDLGISSGTTAQIIARLRRAGVLERTDDPDDARAVLLTLSPAATRRIAAATEGVRDDLDDVLSGLSDAEEAAVVDLLDRVRDVFVAHRDDGHPRTG